MVCIVIPAYDAAPHITGVVRAARASGLPVGVVDDGSRDDTGRLAEQAGATVLRHARNRGKGAALQTGFAWALSRGAQAVLTLDADGQHDPGEIPLLLGAHLRDPEALVIGVRRFDPALMPRRSRIGNTISTFFISRFAGRPLSDSQSGFRIYPAGLIRRARLRTRRFETETELLLWTAKLGLPICQVPIQTIYHGPAHITHFRTLEDTLRVLRLVVGSVLWGVGLLALAGCATGPSMTRPGGRKTTAVVAQRWSTMKAEHRVRIDADRSPEGGGREHLSLTGVIAVARPDRFRLRALGPGGITLFDIVKAGADVRVVHGVPGKNAGLQEKLLPSIGADLGAVYDLEPRPPDRRAQLIPGQDEVRVAETGRDVRLQRFVKIAGQEVPTHIEIRNSVLSYSVSIEVRGLTLDGDLDPALFQLPAP